MIEVNKTTRKYNINPKMLVAQAFDESYARYANEQVAAPPDKVSAISSCLSFSILIAILILTAFTYTENVMLWYGLAGLCLLLLGRSAYKYYKARKEYLNAAGKPSTINKKRKRFFALFSDSENLADLPDVMPAGSFVNAVSRHMGKQEEQIYNAALRSIHEELADKNNPNLPIAKIITPFGDVFNQTKRRFYLVEDCGKLVFFDAEWMNPKGEIVCDISDVVSFGKFSQYPSSINSAGGGKIKPDAVIIELKDSEHHIYFELIPDLYSTVKKLLPSKLEIK